MISLCFSISKPILLIYCILKIISDELCFTVKLESAFYVKKVKPALVKTYQYYSPGKMLNTKLL